MKQIKTIVLLCLVILSTMLPIFCNAQDKVQTPPKFYILDNYSISPEAKTIGVFTMVGGVFWDGFAYIPDSTIVYDKTTLIILGSQIFFQEKVPLKFDFKTLRVLNDEKGIYADQNFIYNLYNLKSWRKYYSIDISKYKVINDYIYQDQNDSLYFLNQNTFGLDKITGLPNLDLGSLKHEVDNYFSDKNGYYLLGRHVSYYKVNGKQEGKLFEGTEKIEKSKLPTPKEKTKFRDEKIVKWNNEAYYQKMPVKEKIDVQNLKFITDNGNETNYMTDGKSLIYLGRMGGYAMETINGKEYVTFNRKDRGNRIIPHANPLGLKIVNKDVLVGDNYIYSGNYDGITIIPIQELGLDVKTIFK